MKKLILFTAIVAITALLSSCTTDQDFLRQQEVDKADWPILEIQGQELQVNPVAKYIGNKLKGLEGDDYIAQLVVVLEDGEVLIADEKYLGKNIEFVSSPEGVTVPSQNYSDIFKDNKIGTKKISEYKGKRILSRAAYVTTASEAEVSLTGEAYDARCGTHARMWMAFRCNGGVDSRDGSFFPTNCSNTPYSWNGYKICGCFGRNRGVYPCQYCYHVFVICEDFGY